MKKSEALDILDSLLKADRINGNLHGVNLDGHVIENHSVEHHSLGQIHKISTKNHKFTVKTNHEGGVTHSDVSENETPERRKIWNKIKGKLKNN